MPVRAEAFGHDPVATLVDGLAFSAASQACASMPGASRGWSVLLRVLRRQLMAALAVSQSGVEVLLVSDRIVGVLATRPPRQIAEAVVRGVVVGVTRLHPRWTWADERLQHECVNGAVDAPLQHDVQVLTSSESAGPQDSAGATLNVRGSGSRDRCDRAIQRANTAGIADLVSAFEAGDRLPLHHRHDDRTIGVC